MLPEDFSMSKKNLSENFILLVIPPSKLLCYRLKNAGPSEGMTAGQSL